MDGRPPPLPSRSSHLGALATALPLGLQHFLAMFVGNVTVPLVVAAAIDLPRTGTASLLQAAMLAAGAATLLQTMGAGALGARLPVVMGASFAFVPTLIPLAQAFGLAGVFGATMAGGLVMATLGFALRWLRFLFPPVVTGTYVLTLGIVLVPVAFRYIGADADTGMLGTTGNLLLAAVVIGVTLLVHQCCGGVLSDLGVLFGIVTGYVVAAASGIVDFAPIAQAPWLQMPSAFSFGLEFHPAAIAGVVVMSVAMCAAEIGSMSGIAAGGFGRDATAVELRGGVAASGFASIFSGALNAFPQTIFSQNVGLVVMTGNGSRHATAIAGLALIAAGLVPKLGLMVATVPAAALGGALVIVFGLIFSVGIKLLQQVDIDKRNMAIIGTSVAVAVGLRFRETLPDVTADPGLQAVLDSGIIPGTVVSIALNLCLPRRLDSREPIRARSLPTPSCKRRSPS